nr:DUF3955 domain-containing protein [Isorropodon fossajaponicum symbiont]
MSLFLLLLGSVFLFLENTFYQYIDTQGWLHESMFMPLGAFSLILGVAGICNSLILLDTKIAL